MNERLAVQNPSSNGACVGEWEVIVKCFGLLWRWWKVGYMHGLCHLPTAEADASELLPNIWMRTNIRRPQRALSIHDLGCVLGEVWVEWSKQIIFSVSGEFIDIIDTLMANNALEMLYKTGKVNLHNTGVFKRQVINWRVKTFVTVLMKKHRCIQVLTLEQFHKQSCIFFFYYSITHAHSHKRRVSPVRRTGSALRSSAVKPEAEMRR